jgi:hypothetical protein
MAFPRFAVWAFGAATYLSLVYGHKHARTDEIASEPVVIPNGQSIYTNTVPPAALVPVPLDQVTIHSNTTSALSIEAAKDSVSADRVNSIALVIARDATSAYSAYSGLNDYGIPYSLLVVPFTGTSLPSLNDSATAGNYGLIVILSEVSYYYESKGYQSALTTDQWEALFNYQVSFGVRMVRLDAYPSEETGTLALGGCCDSGVEQLISISNDSSFTTAGLKR